MAEWKCNCSREGEGETCQFCGEPEMFGYWCEVCGRAVPEKRCPFCGLKARKIRGGR